MMHREIRDREAMLGIEGEDLYTAVEHVLTQIAGHRNLADRRLDADLRERDDAEQELCRLLDCLLRGQREASRPAQFPQDDVRVQQQSHVGWSSMSSSSASVNSKSSAIEMRPEREP